MSEKGKLARKYFEGGYNCSQAVACAFCKEMGLEEKTVLLMMSGFGGGMGRLREVCGAFSASVAVLGVLYGSFDPKDTENKKNLYSTVQELSFSFKEKNGSIICKELLGLSGKSAFEPERRTDSYYKKRPCSDIVETAADILNDYIIKEKKD